MLSSERPCPYLIAVQRRKNVNKNSRTHTFDNDNVLGTFRLLGWISEGVCVCVRLCVFFMFLFRITNNIVLTILLAFQLMPSTDNFLVINFYEVCVCIVFLLSICVFFSWVSKFYFLQLFSYTRALFFLPNYVLALTIGYDQILILLF